ncbi:uncharacterized protein LOC143469691 [Clavelina lepadiformis]|uniref:uncharacterized protein LOC143469691 n=1 Tax=Clavelina lepadiformis TaxID=159417 RepID=UPI0040432A78
MMHPGQCMPHAGEYWRAMTRSFDSLSVAPSRKATTKCKSCDAWLSSVIGYSAIITIFAFGLSQKVIIIWKSFTMVDERLEITAQQSAKEKVDHKKENTKYSIGRITRPGQRQYGEH